MSTYEQESGAQASAHGADLTERAVETAAEVGAGTTYVAGVAGEEAVGVAHDAKEAARGFFDETRTQLMEQAGVQQGRAAEALRSTGDELENLAAGASSGGAATDAVRMIGGQSRRAADWLADREPQDVVVEVRRFARRHTGAFVAIAFGIGIVAGRITRSLMADAQRKGSRSTPRPVTAASPSTGVGSAGVLAGRAGDADDRSRSAASTATTGADANAAGNAGGAASTQDTPIADALANDAMAGDPGTDDAAVAAEPAREWSSAAEGTADGGDAWSPIGEGRR